MPPVDVRELPRLSGRHLLGISELTREDILNVIVTAFRMRNGLLRQHRHSQLLSSSTVVNLFAENSPRTRSSFEIAERGLGVNIVNFSTESSSFKKGETL